MEYKKRFKLYKAGKQWCCAALLSATLIFGVNALTTSVSADPAVPAVSTVNVSTNTATNQVSTSKNNASQSVAPATNNRSNQSANSQLAIQPAPTTTQVPATSRPNSFSTINGNVYYYDPAGRLARNYWYSNWGHRYYFGADGARYTSRRANIPTNSNDEYLFDNYGIMATNRFQTRQGKVYYYGPDGKEYKNEYYHNWGHTYLFGANGARYTNQSYTENGHTYYFDGDGIRLENRFLTQNGHIYYFGNDGARWDNSFMVRWHHPYYFGSDGALVTSTTQSINGHRYSFDRNGIITNPQNTFFTDHDGRVSYFDNRGHEYLNRFYHNWGHMYYFGPDGVRYTNQFYTNWGHHYYFGNGGVRWDNAFMVRWGHPYYFGGDGALVTSTRRRINGVNYNFDRNGIITNPQNRFFTDYDGHVYYFDNRDRMYANRYYYNWGHVYYFGSNGARYTNQLGPNNNYYFGPDGAAQTGLLRTRQGVFYADNQGRLQKNRTIRLSGIDYSFNQQGYLRGGVVTSNGHQYYLDPATGEYRRNFLYTNGNTAIYFDSNTGAGTNALQLQFGEGIVSPDAQYAQGNAAKSYDSNSIENINGFLTADSWYQPKRILQNGTTWVDNTQNAWRPLLMVWWPNRQVLVDYLNYMKQNNLLSSHINYNANSNLYELTTDAQQVQQNIEHHLSTNHNDISWLRNLMHNFVTSESIWNVNSESQDYGGLQLQGGFLKYDNSSLTPYANSNWRLLGRQPVNIRGNGAHGSEFLLANDIDNSNPVVQAEQLNWLYYLLNFGTITANDNNANFDGIRVDAVDNVDADLLNIAADYFKAAYGVDQNDARADAHINILEDWSGGDPAYDQSIGNPQLTLDNYFSNIRNDMNSTTRSLRDIITSSLVNRAYDGTEDVAQPNYSFIRAHDNGSQDEIRQAIAATTHTAYGHFNLAQEQAGIQAYIADQNQVNKRWNYANLPADYAIILTNKDTVPRVYYGDLYTDGGQYMATRTRYYPALTTMLEARVKYVAGGQTMNVDQHNILTSVRFGKGALTSDALGTAETRTEGIGVIISNNDHLSLQNGDTVVLHMGAAHRNQRYRALILPTTNGLATYPTDANAPVAYTDANGDLTFTNHDLDNQANTAIRGYANPDVRGYLAIWVPAGAAADQDARTAASTVPHYDGQVFHSNAALDSNVIFEGFSNFVYWPTNSSERANVKIAQNANLFKQLGITSFELAPQYNSSKDGTFLDSMIDNGYAFTDRYDLGMSTPNKYGSADDLRNAIRALHQAGIQAIADWVPDQIYNLPGEEVVTATRVDEFGNTWNSSSIKNTLYVANTIGGGRYQQQYGGAFLDELKARYPQLFEKRQVSTGVPIDPSVKIKQWSARYFNGTNILHRGADYVLRGNDGTYFTISGHHPILPAVLTGVATTTGFVRGQDGNYHYYTPYGQEVTNSFVQDNTGNWYYFDNSGNMLRNTSLENITIDGATNTYLFLNNGRSFRSGLAQVNGVTYYFDGDGHMVKNQTVTDGAMTYVLDANGRLVSESYNPDAANAHPLRPGDLDPTTHRV